MQHSALSKIVASIVASTDTNHFRSWVISRLVILSFGLFSIPSFAFSPELNADAGQTPLRLANLAVDVKVVGNLASTKLTMDFQNDTNRVLEGELVFPLAEGQTITQFALDVNGNMRDAVTVAKNEGRRIFENITRQGIDPGILEKVASNSFKLRVYPILANSSKRVEVTYDEVLTKGQYCSPVALEEAVDRYALAVAINQPHHANNSKAPQALGAVQGLMPFDKSQNQFVSQFTRQNFQPNGQMCFSLPINTAVTNANNAITQVEAAADGGVYLHVQLPIPSADAATVTANTTGAVNPNQNIAVYWDVSGSQADIDANQVVALLEQYMQQQELQGVQSITLEVQPFAHAVLNQPIILQRKNGQYTNHQNNLTAAIASLQYDGGTQLGALDLTNTGADSIFIVTNGVSNLGATDPLLPTFGSTTVHTINASPIAEHSRLQHLANRTGGHYINLQTTNLVDAAKQLSNTSPYQLLEAQAVQIGQSASQNTFAPAGEHYPKLGVITDAITTAAGNNQQLEFITYLPTAPDQLLFTLGVPAGENTLERYTLTLEMPQTAHNNTGILERLWAQRHIAALELEPEKNRARIIAAGKRYNIATRYTTMIVLDRISDYVDNDIIPPQELRAEYDRLIAQKTKTQQQSTTERLNQVAARWAQEIAWWDTRHARTKPGPRWQREQAAYRSASARVDNDAGLLGVTASGNVAMTASSDSSTTEISEAEALRDSLQPVIAPPAPPLAVPAPIVTADHNLNDDSVSASAKAQPLEFSRKANIQLQAWNPNMPYIKELEQTISIDAAYAQYLDIRPQYTNSSAFFLDVADYFNEQQRADLALRVLSNIAEMELENVALMRILAYRLLQLEQTDLAINLFERVLALRDDEPQSWRDLGLAYAQAGRDQDAVDTLWEVVRKPWPRFAEIEIVVLHELNNIIHTSHQALDLSAIDERVKSDLPLDLRIVLTWDADNTDIDLWVTDPYGEKTFYSNPNSRIGGRISRDFTGGYGPEHYLIRRAVPGDYTIEANYYGTQQQTLTGKTTIQAEIFTNWGKPDEKRQAITLRLNNQSEVVKVGTANIGG